MNTNFAFSTKSYRSSFLINTAVGAFLLFLSAVGYVLEHVYPALHSELTWGCLWPAIICLFVASLHHAKSQPALLTAHATTLGTPSYAALMDHRKVITIEPGKRGGRPCIRGTRISVYDILGWLAAGMTNEQIIEDFPDLTLEDIRASLAYAADRDHHLVGSAV